VLLLPGTFKSSSHHSTAGGAVISSFYGSSKTGGIKIASSIGTEFSKIDQRVSIFLFFKYFLIPVYAKQTQEQLNSFLPFISFIFNDLNVFLYIRSMLQLYWQL